MTISTILAALEDYLTPLVRAQGGLVEVAETEEDALMQLGSNAPDRFRVILSTAGEKAPEDSGRGGHIRNEVTAFVQAPRGFEPMPGQGLHRHLPSKCPTFLERLNFVIKNLRAVELDSDSIDGQESLNYRGWEWVKYQDLPAWRAARATFEVLYVLDDAFTAPRPMITLPATIITGVSAEGDFYLLSRDGLAAGRVPRLVTEDGDAAVAVTPLGMKVSDNGDFLTVSDFGSFSGYAELQPADEADVPATMPVYRITGISEDGSFFIVKSATTGAAHGRLSRFAA